MDDPVRKAVLDAAHEFVDAVVPELKGEGVLPVSRYHTQLRVGYDYFGDTIRGVAEYGRFAEALNEAFPERFSEDKPLGERDFANRYMSDYLEAVISACASNSEEVSSTSTAIHNVDLELLKSLKTNQFDIVVCSKVKHMTTETNDPINFGDIRVIPIPNDHTSFWEEVKILQGIPRMGAVLRDGPPHYFAQPASMIITEGTGTDQTEVGEESASRIRRFILCVRLLTNATVAQVYEIRGSNRHIGCYDPEVYNHNVNPDRVQRTATLSGSNCNAIQNLEKLLGQIENEGKGNFSTPLVTAIRKVSATYRWNSWDDHLVDLVTALEAALCDSEMGELKLRVRFRAAKLLSTENDSAGDIFDDIGAAYDLRSRFVHGADIKIAKLNKYITGLSRGFQDRDIVGTAVLTEAAIDRLRDLARRAILARMCLAYCGDRPWPINPQFGADSKLIDESIAAKWRKHWHDELNGLGATSAGTMASATRLYGRPA